MDTNAQTIIWSGDTGYAPLATDNNPCVRKESSASFEGGCNQRAMCISVAWSGRAAIRIAAEDQFTVAGLSDIEILNVRNIDWAILDANRIAELEES